MSKRRRIGNDELSVPRKKRIRPSFYLSLPKKPTISTLGRMGQVGQVRNVVSACAGSKHTVLLNNRGMVYTFGRNEIGALGRDSLQDADEFTPGRVALPGRAVMISAGDSHSACLLDDGRVFAWGSFWDSNGNMALTLARCMLTPTEMFVKEQCISIASGSKHLVILTCNGHVFTVGCADQGQLGRISSRSASGKSRRGYGPMLSPARVMLQRGKLVDAIWASNYSTFVREWDTGDIWAFGLNDKKQLACRKEDRVVWSPVPTKFSDVKQIAGGEHHTLVLKNDGTCHIIGRHEDELLGLGDIKNDVTELTKIPNLKDIEAIACGDTHSFAVKTNGELFAWGMGSYDQNGTGFHVYALDPVLIESKQSEVKKLLYACGSEIMFTTKGLLAAVLESPDLRAIPIEANRIVTKSHGESEEDWVKSNAGSKPRGARSRPARKSPTSDESEINED